MFGIVSLLPRPQAFFSRAGAILPHLTGAREGPNTSIMSAEVEDARKATPRSPASEAESPEMQPPGYPGDFAQLSLLTLLGELYRPYAQTVVVPSPGEALTLDDLAERLTELRLRVGNPSFA